MKNILPEILRFSILSVFGVILFRIKDFRYDYNLADLILLCLVMIFVIFSAVNIYFSNLNS